MRFGGWNVGGMKFGVGRLVSKVVSSIFKTELDLVAFVQSPSRYCFIFFMVERSNLREIDLGIVIIL